MVDEFGRYHGFHALHSHLVYFFPRYEIQEAALDLLLDSGADLSSRDANNNTALHHACLQQQKTTALQLLEKASEAGEGKQLYAFINAANDEQKTPLHIAGNYGLTEVCFLRCSSRFRHGWKFIHSHGTTYGPLSLCWLVVCKQGLF